MSTITGKQNAVRDIKSHEKYHNLQAQDSSKLSLHATVFRKMIDSQKYDLIKNVFKQEKYFLSRVTE